MPKKPKQTPKQVSPKAKVAAQIRKLYRQKQTLIEEIEDANQEVSRLRNEIGELASDLHRKLAEFAPSNKSITLPKERLYVATTFHLEARHIFLLSQVDKILFKYEQENRVAPAVFLNDKLMSQLFGSVNQALEYGRAQFVVCSAIPDLTIVVVASVYLTS